ncbi:unnamed protein product, partial [Medioppia subpectinata]
TLINSTSKPSTSQSSQEMTNKDMNKKSSEDSMQMPSKQSMSKFLAQNKTRRRKCFNKTKNAFICPINKCHKSCETDFQFRRHVTAVHGERQFLCTHEGCGKGYTTRSALRVHQLLHKTVKSFHCPHNGCEYEAIDDYYFTQHVKRRHSNQSVSEVLLQNVTERKKCYEFEKKAFICPINDCHKSYKTDVQFSHHLKSVHSDGQYVCEYIGCENVLKSKNGFNLHLLGHKKAKPFHCPHNGCESKAVSDRYLKAHLKTHSTESVVKGAEPLIQYTKAFTLNTWERKRCFDPKTKTWKCPGIECQKALKTRKLFNQHLYNIHSEPRFKCHYEGCDKIFTHKDRLDNHLVVHKNDKKFKCDYKDCEYAGRTKWALKSHMVSHLTDRPVIECSVDGCGKAFKLAKDLAQHSRVHLSDPTIRCGADGCNEMFFHSYERLKHQISVHNRKRKKYKPQRKQRCDWPGCEYSGTYLSYHKLKHTGERPHVCVWPDCGKSYANKLRLMIGPDHTGERPHVCVWPDCGKSYANKLRLRDHMNIHNNVRPFVCQWPGCEYSATGSSILFNHKNFKCTIIDGEDNQDFWLLCQTLDQLSDETYGSVGHHIKIELEDQMKSPSNDQQMRQRYETQEVNQNINDNNNDVNEDMFAINGLELRTGVKVEAEDSMEPINTQLINKSSIKMQTQVNSTSKPSTSQSSQEMVNIDSNEDSMEMTSNESMSQFLRQNKSEREKCFDLTLNAFVCPINKCHKSFKKDVNFAMHFRRTHTTKQYMCTHEGCGQAFKTQYTLRTHQSIHKNIKLFHCPHNGCQYKGISDNNLKLHLRAHFTDKVFRCDVNGCDYQTFKYKTLKNHAKRKHKIINGLDLGSVVIKEPEDNCVNTDMSSMTNEIQRQVNSTSKPSTSQSSQEMVNIDMNEESNEDSMEMTSKQSMSQLLAQNKTKRSECFDRTLNAFICPINKCHKSFQKDIPFQQHLPRTHTPRQYICTHEGCGKGFKLKDSFSRHVLTHESIKSFHCPQNGCEFKASISYYLTEHLKRHSTDKVFRCNVNGCDYYNFNAKNLRVHKKTHTKTQSFQCYYNGCQYKASSYHCLKGHLRTHSTDKQFRCDVNGCDFHSFNRKSLSRHMENMHKNIQSFQCHYNGCQYKCVNNRLLTSHLKTHSTDRTDGVNSKNELNVHRLTHGSEPTITCGADGCNDMFYTYSQRLRHRVSVHNRRTRSYRRGKQWFEWTSHKKTVEDKQWMSKRRQIERLVKTRLICDNSCETDTCFYKRQYVCTREGCGKGSKTNHNIKAHLIINY